MNLGRIDYAAGAPDGYRCTVCGLHGCKLWRRVQTCADAVGLVCCDCAGKSQTEDVSDIDDEGRGALDPKTFGPGRRSDQIGWLVPAVPTEEGDTFWGYTSVPAEGVAWWRRLPTRSAQ